MPKSIVLLNLNFHRKTAAHMWLRRCACIVAILCCTDASAEMVQTSDPAVLKHAKSSPYGWVARENLPEDLQKQVPPGCKGLYIEAIERGERHESADLDTEPLNIEADDASVIDGSTATLSGNVVVSQGDRAIGAGKMIYDRETDRAVLENNVTIRQPGMLIKGEYAEVSTNEHRARFDDASFIFKEQQIRGSAETVQQLSRGKLSLRGGRVTTCEPGDESWVLEGEEITVDQSTSQGTGRNVKLKIGRVPVFYLPYISFPVGDQRQTGLLFPSISSSDDGGLDFALPYYWNLAPNYDLTLAPRFISGRGTMLELETRYLNRWLRTEIGFAYLPDDGGSQDPDLDDLIQSGEITREEARPYQGNNRWLSQFSLNSSPTDGWYMRSNYTRVSDEDYFRDLGTSSLSVANKTFLDQSLEVGYQFDHWKVASLVQTQQVLLLDIETPYRKLPQIDINGRYNWNNWIATLNNRYTQFRHSNEAFDPDNPDNFNITGDRVNTEYRFSWENRRTWGYFVPELGYKSLYYQLDLENNPSIGPQEDARFGLSTPQASLDMGLVFEHSGGKYTQTIEPRVYYLYRKFVDHSKLFDLGNNPNLDINFDTSERTFSYSQLYRDSRFIGGDRLDDANQTTLGLTTRWTNNATGDDLFVASAGQIFHAHERRVTLAGTRGLEETEDSSEFASELFVNIGPRTQLYANAIFDTASRNVNRGSSGVNFASRNYQKLFNVSYAFLRDLAPPLNTSIPSRDIDQLDVSFAFPVNPQWALMGRHNYDFQNKQELETFLGFEYNDCCYRFRILARKWLDSNIANLTANKDAQYDQGIFFEIHFKGLGGSGAKVNSILNDGIFGYDAREQRLH